MKKTITIFLQILIVLIGIVVLAFLLWEPQLEGRNIHATLFEMYFKDPFLAYVYLGSIPFFVGLYQIFKVLQYTRENKLSAPEAITSVRKIQYCAVITAGSILGAATFILIHARLYPDLGATDGPEGVLMISILAIFISIVVAGMAGKFEGGKGGIRTHGPC